MTDFPDYIAQRTLKSGDLSLVVSIAKPEHDGDDFRCAYSLVVDGGIQKTGYALGMDSVQALQLVMRKIETDVIAIGQHLGTPFSWFEDEPGVSGFG